MFAKKGNRTILFAMIERWALPMLRVLAGHYPVVVLTGPRQSGKTTLAKTVFPHLPYCSLEDLDQRTLAETDPRSFLARFGEGAIFDEVQRAPNLVSFLQGLVDQDPRPGRYILTGSHQLGLRSQVDQSLAGRAGHLVLPPLADGELRAAGCGAATLEETLFQGGYPAIHDRGIPARLWLGDYLATYLERDLWQVTTIRNLRPFRIFLSALAGHVGQLVDLTTLAATCSITRPTAKAWLSILEERYLVRLVQPWHANHLKRLVKHPRLYFHDTGLAVRLLGITDASQIRSHWAFGALFENWVVSELVKADAATRSDAGLHFWRTHDGREVDALIVRNGRADAIECKAGATIASDWFQGLESWSRATPDAAQGRRLVVAGTDQIGAKGDITVVPWQEWGKTVRTLF